MDLLQQMARRWAGLVRYDPRSCDNAAGKYAERLRLLHEKCMNGIDFGTDVLDYINDSLLTIGKESGDEEGDFAQNLSGGFPNTAAGPITGTIPEEGGTPERHTTDWTEKPFFMDSPPREPEAVESESGAPASDMAPSSFAVPVAASSDQQMRVSLPYSSSVQSTGEADSDLVALSQGFMEPDFAGMDRIIGLNDSFLGDLIQPGEQQFL